MHAAMTSTAVNNLLIILGKRKHWLSLISEISSASNAQTEKAFQASKHIHGVHDRHQYDNDYAGRGFKVCRFPTAVLFRPVSRPHRAEMHSQPLP